jgi:hypothetical protein
LSYPRTITQRFVLDYLDLKQRLPAGLVEPSSLSQHTSYTPHNRSIVADWLMDITEDCSYHRQTYWLALLYFDKFMAGKALHNHLATNFLPTIRV